MVTRGRQVGPWSRPLLPPPPLLLVLVSCCWGVPLRQAATPTAEFCASCHASARCFHEQGKSVCICNYGFIGNGRTYCNDKDECQIGAHNICGNHSACHNTYGSFFCTCHDGFQPSNSNGNNTYIPNDGTFCKDIDECSISGLCGYGATCRNTHGSYECYCMEGYTPENGTQPFRTDGNLTGSCTDLDCGLPMAPPNAVIVSANRTTFGSEVTYSCQKGFAPNGGSSTATCTADGSWEGATVACTAIECGRPPMVANADITFDPTTVYGSKSEYRCMEGFYSEAGTNVSTCTENGVWETPTLSCKAVDCGKPPVVLNALASLHRNTTYGSEIEYECQYGYIIERGNTTADCNARGEWEGADLVCRAVDCGAPPAFPHTQIGPHSNTTYGSEIAYECQYGYSMESGNMTALCGASGQWEGADPVCRAVDCGDPPPLPNALMGSYGNTTFENTVVYECHNGYIIESGNTTAVCNGRGQWIGASLVCRAVDCGAPPSFTNASAGWSSNTSFGSVAIYECQNGYVAENGNQTAVCNGAGEWEAADPLCREIDCGAPPVIHNTVMVWDRSTKLGSVVHYQCLDGFYSHGQHNHSTCTIHQLWENVTFSCQAIDCGRPPLIPHTRLIWDNSTGAGSVALYACQKGFHWTHGKNVSQCTSQGSWEVPDVVCKELTCGIPKRIEHADLVWSGNSSVGSQLYYMCKMGFAMSGGKNSSLCTEEGVWEDNALKCTAVPLPNADIISNLLLINETCVKWRRASGSANWKLFYSVHIQGKRWHQMDFSHSIAFNFTTEAWNPTVCLNLRPGTNYTMNITAAPPEGSRQRRTLMIQTGVKKFDIKVIALNETCLQWGSADGETVYQFHVRGSRRYQEDFTHNMTFNRLTDLERPTVCLRLRPGTNYSVIITAAISQSTVDFSMTTRIADPPLPELPFIEALGPAPKLKLRRAEERNGPISSYQIFVLPVGIQTAFNCNSLPRSSFFANTTSTEGYVAAEILPQDFVDHLEFSLGDRQYYGEFYNAPLRRGKDYCIILRITSQWNKERAQSCMKWAQVKDIAPTRQHVTLVGVGSLAVVCFFLFISFSAAWCCKRR